MATASIAQRRIDADIAAFDRDGNLVLVVEVKARQLSEQSAGEILRSLIDEVRSISGFEAIREALITTVQRSVGEAIRDAVAPNPRKTINDAIRGAVAPHVLEQVGKGLDFGGLCESASDAVAISKRIDDAIRRAADDVMGPPSEGDPVYVMLVDLKSIRIARIDELQAPLVLNTVEILSRYDPDFETEQILKRYLTTLVKAWIRDIAHRWKSESPPGCDHLISIGLATRLQDGSTSSEVEIGCHPVH